MDESGWSNKDLYLIRFLYEKAETGTTSGGRRYGADHQSL